MQVNKLTGYVVCRGLILLHPVSIAPVRRGLHPRFTIPGNIVDWDEDVIELDPYILIDLFICITRTYNVSIVI